MSDLRKRKANASSNSADVKGSPKSPDVEVKQSMVVTEDTKVIEPARIADEFLVFVTFMVSFALRFFRLDWPNGVVFDETHFGRFTNQYHAGTFLFDIHPPLGKLLFYWVTKLFNYDYRECGYQEIHDLYSEDCKFMILRGTAATFGLVTPVLLYYVIRNFSGGKWAAFLGATLMNFDMLNLMESRFILMDSQLMFWATASLLVAQKWWKRMNQHSLAQEELNVIRLLRSKLGIRSPRTTGITKEKIPKEEKYLLKWQIYATSQMVRIEPCIIIHRTLIFTFHSLIHFVDAHLDPNYVSSMGCYYLLFCSQHQMDCLSYPCYGSNRFFLRIEASA